MLTSCATTVSFTSLIPAQVNMTGYETIAVAGTKEYKGAVYPLFPSKTVELQIDSQYPVPSYVRDFNAKSTRGMYEKAASYTGEAFADSLNKGFFKIVGPKATDGFIAGAKALGTTVRATLLKNSIDAIITSSVDVQTYREYITCEKTIDQDGWETYKYYLHQQAELTVSYLAQDVETTAALDKDTYTKKYDNYGDLIGTLKRKTGEKDVWVKGYDFSREPVDIFRDMIDSVSSVFYKRFTPYQTVTSISLKSSKSDALKTAADLVKNQQYKAALEIYANEWNAYGDVNAAYNAIIMTAATKGFAQAIELADMLVGETRNADIIALKNQFINIYGKDTAARNQLSGEKAKLAPETELVGF